MEGGLVDKITALRRELHQHPQVSYQEFQTHKRIKKVLLQFGVESGWIREVCKEGQGPTGMIVDIKGRGAAKGQDFCVAFRADMDALSMVELNQDLPYKSKNVGAAHTCGHDGHMACLVGFVPLFLQQIDNIPQNKTVRLIFQPSEEGPLHGAELMIQNGCLQGVNEVYGFHNWPVGKFGDVRCKAGAVMSQISILKIKILGDGGHGSAPEGLQVAIWKAVWFYSQLMQYINKLKLQGRNFACTLPVFQSGQRFNVIGESAWMEGSLRTFDSQTRDLVLGRVRGLLAQIEKEGFTVEYTEIVSCRNQNSKDQAQNVLRVARDLFGEQKSSEGELPFRASEDFGCYTQLKPGAFFFFCSKVQQSQPFLHNPKYNFKDGLIQPAMRFWLKLAQDRLNSC